MKHESLRSGGEAYNRNICFCLLTDGPMVGGGGGGVDKRGLITVLFLVYVYDSQRSQKHYLVLFL